MCVCVCGVCVMQDYASMVALVEKLPDHEQAQKAPVQLQYAFALNRRNQPGDRNKALTILEKVQSFEGIVVMSFVNQDIVVFVCVRQRI